MIALPSRGRTVLVLSSALALLALWAGWAPVDRADWILENALTVLTLAALAASYRVLPLSRLSYALIFLFLCLHTVGVVFGGGLGAAFLGSQGDPWDAQKDMAVASLGALVTMLVTAAVNARFRRDFAREFVESLRVKDPRPHGEETLRRMTG
ncbi:MAG TPA: DUF2238 domain-containing protein [Anaeromyxobacter sp.]|nr:DUF2238 domain-containing protein [Anaeromyxobacter sp.]